MAAGSTLFHSMGRFCLKYCFFRYFHGPCCRSHDCMQHFPFLDRSFLTEILPFSILSPAMLTLSSLQAAFSFPQWVVFDGNTAVFDTFTAIAAALVATGSSLLSPMGRFWLIYCCFRYFHGSGFCSHGSLHVYDRYTALPAKLAAWIRHDHIRFI